VKELILGGVRSGKSAHAERLARASGCAVAFIASAIAGDDEMAARIARHREDRPGDWLVIEEPVTLGGALRRAGAGRTFVIVDCLTLWLSNVLFPNALRDPAGAEPIVDGELFERERTDLVAALGDVDCDVVLISNEVSMGVVPASPSARRFCDEAGRLHQELAQRCDRVTLMVAGVPVAVKGA
jgi:adenosylcobinamide kinase / adenosylcobinamide-phosphate guanylyltransferase